MEYTLEKLQKDFQKGKPVKFLFFWGHAPSPDGRVTQSCLSQWWRADFTVEGIRYCCMEQYMMAEKARLFGDMEIRAQILNCGDPKQIKALGRKVRNFGEQAWQAERGGIVVRGNTAKFSQNSELGAFLKGTKRKVLVEASPLDRIWGIGMGAENEKAQNPLLWKGLNLLGFALMEARDRLGSGE